MADITNLKPEAIANTQPQITVPMMSESAGGNRNALNCPIGPDGKRDWSYGLFDCFSACDFSYLAGCCPHIAYTQEIQHLRSLQHQGTPLPANSERNDDQCCIPKALQVTPCMHIRFLEETRERYGIRGSVLGDCCIFAWCLPCGLTRAHREIELEEISFRPSEGA